MDDAANDRDQADHETDAEYDPAAEIERLTAENAALKDQALRVAADAETTKRRAERDANDARAYAIQKFARDLLGAADNLASAVEHAPKGSGDPAINNLVTGIEMTEKALQDAFDRNGLKRIAPEKGEKFDPNLHQAMMEQPAEGVPPGAVVLAMQSGYQLLGRLVRPAMVVVTPKAASASATANPEAQAYANGADPGGPGASVDQKA